jgi:hypothetical protein
MLGHGLSIILWDRLAFWGHAVNELGFQRPDRWQEVACGLSSPVTVTEWTFELGITDAGSLGECRRKFVCGLGEWWGNVAGGLHAD